MLNCHQDLEVCNCDCHDRRDTSHIIPCCQTCNVCRLNIRTVCVADHLASHSNEAGPKQDLAKGLIKDKTLGRYGGYYD